MIKLYGMTSPFVHRTRAVLEFKNLSYEQECAQLRNRSDTFNHVSPIGKIPVLEDNDGTIIWDSANIAAYLDLMYPETYQIFSSEPKKRAQIGNIVALADKILDVSAPIIADVLKIKKISTIDREIARNDISYRMERAYGLLRENEFFVDDRFTYADASMLSALGTLQTISEDISIFSDWFKQKMNDPKVASMFASQDCKKS